jgi:hypothetical protein
VISLHEHGMGWTVGESMHGRDNFRTPSQGLGVCRLHGYMHEQELQLCLHDSALISSE